MADALFLSACFVVVLISVTSLGLDSSLLESLLIFFLVFSVEPLFVAFTGSSFGHHLVGLRVRRSARDARLSIFFSYLRFLVKIPLGSLSLITVLTSRRHQALHDVISRSLVVHKHLENLPSYEIVEERFSESDGFVYPSKLRRSVMIIFYVISLLLLIVLSNLLSISEPCINGYACNKTDSLINFVSSVVSLGGIFVIIWAGWNGRLFGSRRSRKGRGSD